MELLALLGSYSTCPRPRPAAQAGTSLSSPHRWAQTQAGRTTWCCHGCTHDNKARHRLSRSSSSRRRRRVGKTEEKKKKKKRPSTEKKDWKKERKERKRKQEGGGCRLSLDTLDWNEGAKGRGCDSLWREGVSPVLMDSAVDWRGGGPKLRCGLYAGLLFHESPYYAPSLRCCPKSAFDSLSNRSNRLIYCLW